MRMNPVIARSFDPDLLSRVEDAGLNASAPPQQRWLDGWLVRLSPGKAKRARCINAVAPGRMPIAHKLALCEPVYAQAELPLIVRITPFSEPTGLDATLEAHGPAALRRHPRDGAGGSVQHRAAEPAGLALASSRSGWRRSPSASAPCAVHRCRSARPTASGWRTRPCRSRLSR